VPPRAAAPALPPTSAGNRRLMETFVELFYRQRRVRAAFEAFVSGDRYVQHDASIPAGREAAIAALEPKFAAPGFDVRVLRLVVEDDLAVVHLMAYEPDGRGPAALVNIFRIEAGRIVEFWGVLQPLGVDALLPARQA